MFPGPLSAILGVCFSHPLSFYECTRSILYCHQKYLLRWKEFLKVLKQHRIVLVIADSWLFCLGRRCPHHTSTYCCQGMSNESDVLVVSTDTPSNTNTKTRIDYTYNPKKPRWWKNVSGKATKGQKRAMESILMNHRLPVVPYGHFIDWFDIFPEENDIWLEIGFGQGDNLLSLAHLKRDEKVSFVGAEIHHSGIGTVCTRMQQGIEKNKFWTDYETFSGAPGDGCLLDNGPDTADKMDTEVDEAECITPYKNLRLHKGDGVKLLPYLTSSSLAAVLVTFPDPFPKVKQAQWRVVQTHTVLQLHRILRKSGQFFLATDHEGFNDWSHSVMKAVNKEKELFRKLEPCPNRLDWLPVVSKYENKGWDEGRRTNLSCWVKAENDDN
jgi:tRNA (guanine-N7-)-methyltransferase